MLTVPLVHATDGMNPEELRERLLRFAAEVARFVAPLFEQPRWREAADQLSRSSASAMANYRSAGRARSHLEFTSKIGQALEEIDEAQGWLKYLHECAVVRSADRQQFDSLVQECAELTAILSAATATARRRDRADKARRK